MSRSLSFIALLLLAVVSFGLYRLSYEVQRMEDELIELNRALARERETIGVLQAEWSYLSRPEYLQDKAERLLGMKPATAKNIANIESLPWRQDRPGATQPGATQPGTSQPGTSQATPPLAAAPAQPAKAVQDQLAAAAASAAPVSAAPVSATQVSATPVSSVSASAGRGADDLDADVAAVLGAMRGDRKRVQ